MNKKITITVLCILLIITGAVIFIFAMPSKNTAVTPAQQKDTRQDEPTKQPSEQPTRPQPGKYVDYSEAELAATTGTRLLFFHASWCPQCREMERSIKEDGLPDNVTVLKVDYDTNQKLRQKYEVTLQTTFVKVDKNGNKIASYVAYSTPQFDAVAKELLP